MVFLSHLGQIGFIMAFFRIARWTYVL